ncbi:hypothetical protein GCM10010329_80590 [Streptomyces spiroverticillatus]|uniref:ASCH domain-containing protein n=1 Tax=Streptomyces finlayi TaxID=67296 RepID=A0A918X7W4_9ACTN|nr:hypothetical protein [Streptomyces finlayi]GHA45900.1 hypothetical protein GCM10010329_80590 [Streptomyces spiroverticillatus]GHD15955.1 hypothetical protein GCM10010334_76510 [Streptomyces finlayi]
MNTPLPKGDWIRAISIKQPWVTAILTGQKTVENRGRDQWPWRGLLLLHASQSLDRPALRHPLVATTVRGRELVTGAVVSVARLIDCHRDADGVPPCTPWSELGAVHLVLRDVQELALPVPALGRLGLWKPSEDLLTQVLQQLPDLRP